MAKIERYVSQQLADISTDSRENQIRCHWMSFAEMYFQAKDYQKAQKYLSELLELDPSHIDANLLIVQIYMEEKRWKNVLELLLVLVSKKMTDLNSKPSGWSHSVSWYIGEAGKYFAPLATLKDVEIIQKCILMLLTKRKNIYLNDSLNALDDVLKSILQKAETASFLTPEISDDLKLLFLSEQSLANESLNIHLMRVLLLINEKDLVATNVLERRYTFVDCFEWNRFVVEHIDIFDYFPETERHMLLHFYDNLVRLSLHENISSFPLIKNYEIKINEYLSFSKNSVFSSETIWKHLRLEHLSRVQLYLAFATMSEFLSGDQTDEKQVMQAFDHLLYTLSYVSNAEHRDILEKLSQEMRFSNAAEGFIAILWVFDIFVLLRKESDLPLFQDIADDLTFRLPSFSEIPAPESWCPRPLAAALKYIDEKIPTLSEFLVFLPWNLTDFVKHASWRFNDGSVRRWLRKIFPDLSEYPAVKQIANAKSVPTIADLESFILMLLIQRHQSIISTEVAQNFERVLMYSTFGSWRCSHVQQSFWHSVLYHHGSKTYVQRSIYANNILPQVKVAECLQEIRGDGFYGPNHRNFYFLVASTFHEIYVQDKLDKSLEAVHYYRVVLKYDNYDSKLPAKSSFLFEGDVFKMLQSHSDDFDMDERIEEFKRYPECRYMRYISENPITFSPLDKVRISNYSDTSMFFGDNTIGQENIKPGVLFGGDTSHADLSSEKSFEDDAGSMIQPLNENENQGKLWEESITVEETNKPERAISPSRRLKRQLERLKQLKQQRDAISQSGTENNNEANPQEKSDCKSAVQYNGKGSRLKRQLAQLHALRNMK